MPSSPSDITITSSSRNGPEAGGPGSAVCQMSRSSFRLSGRSIRARSPVAVAAKMLRSRTTGGPAGGFSRENSRLRHSSSVGSRATSRPSEVHQSTPSASCTGAMPTARPPPVIARGSRLSARFRFFFPLAATALPDFCLAVFGPASVLSAARDGCRSGLVGNRITVRSGLGAYTQVSITPWPDSRLCPNGRCQRGRPVDRSNP